MAEPVYMPGEHDSKSGWLPDLMDRTLFGGLKGCTCRPFGCEGGAFNDKPLPVLAGGTLASVAKPPLGVGGSPLHSV